MSHVTYFWGYWYKSDSNSQKQNQFPPPTFVFLNVLPVASRLTAPTGFVPIRGLKERPGLQLHLHIFLRSALYGVEYPASRPSRFTSGKKALISPWIRVWVDPPEPVWTFLETRRNLPQSELYSRNMFQQGVAKYLNRDSLFAIRKSDKRGA